MKLKPRRVNGSSRAILWGAVAGSVVCFGSVPCGQSQTVQSTQVADYVMPTHLSQSTAPRPTMQTKATSLTELKGQDLSNHIIKPTVMTSADRWIRFESEYGIKQESPSPIGRMFQAAKYGLDRMTFTAQETAKNCEFTHDLGDEPAYDPGCRSAAPQYSPPMFGRFGRAQFKSEVTVHDPETGQAFIGLKLSIPFGQGG